MSKPIPDIVRTILAGRGMTDEQDIKRFLNPSYDDHLHDPFLLTEMEPAVARILQAAANCEKVVIYGDYDIDGITASAIMIEGLRPHGIEATSYIPDRFEEGYGINQAALAQLKEQRTDLVISVDCGITSVQEAAWARDNGLDLIITDHHAVPEIIPQAVAVINPKRPGDGYPFKDLCGAGVAFKLVQALQQKTGVPALGQEKWLLDLVALGTVCDIVTLVDENRVLVTYGLKVMRRTRRPGLRALANVGGIDIAAVTSQNLGFVLGPRMNAAGRLEHAARSVELMLTNDPARALTIAEELDQLNAERRATQAVVVREAGLQAEQRSSDPVLVLADASWSHGIVGIVASKLVEQWQRPVLVAQIMGEVTKGSARSTGGYNMVEALRSCSGLLTKFGGHYFAAGYTLPTDRLPQFRDALSAYFNTSGAGQVQVPPRTVDARMDGLDQATSELVTYLGMLEPFGAANPEPVFEFSGTSVTEVRAIGKEATHLKLSLRDDGGNVLGAIGFGLKAKFPDLKAGRRITAYGRLGTNEWQGRTSLQLAVTDLRYE